MLEHQTGPSRFKSFLIDGLTFCFPLFPNLFTQLIKEAAECVKNDYGSIDILVHSLANGPEVMILRK